jgi:urease subunit beta/urease subunit gamma/beta
MIPGEYIVGKGEVVCNQGHKAIKLKVTNTGDRPVQVGSSYHFFEVNRKMKFDRTEAFGRRLNIPSGTAVRFEPGEEKTVELVDYGGLRRVFGNNSLVDGDTSLEYNKEQKTALLKSKGFLTTG